MTTKPARRLNRRNALGVLAVTAGIGLSGCGARKDVIRYRLTLRALVDGQIREGSSVREEWYTEDPPLLPSDGTANRRWRGEAAVLDLGRGRYLFGLLDGYTTMNGYRERSFGPWSPILIINERKRRASGPPWSSFDEIVAELGDRPIELSPEELPLLVTFSDVTDRRTAALFDPTKSSEVLPGITLERCTAQITRDRVTVGEVDAVLPWVGDGPSRVTGANYDEIVVSDEFKRD